MSMNAPATGQKRKHRVLRLLCFLCVWAVLLLLTVWASAALYFDLPWPALRIPAAAAFAVAMLLADKVLGHRDARQLRDRPGASGDDHAIP